MATFKSTRFKPKHSRWAKANTPGAKRRRRATADAKRLAAPAPLYVDYRPGSEHVTVTVSGPGWMHVLRATVPAGRARSDQHDVTHDDRPLPDVRTLTALFRYARGLVPRRLSRDELNSCSWSAAPDALLAAPPTT